jgi:RNA polymerase sigma-70 factor (ECF subfamily)
MKLSKEDFKKLKDGDSIIFEKLYNYYKDMIYNYLMILSKDREIANDIFSNTMYSAFRSIGKLKNDKNIYQWFLRIAKNRYNDYLRKIYKDKKIKDSLKENISEDFVENDFIEVEEKEAKVRLLNLALKNIKPEYSNIIKYKYFDGLSHKEIAKKINKSIDASESLLQRGINAIKKEFRNLSDFF